MYQVEALRPLPPSITWMSTTPGLQRVGPDAGGEPHHETAVLVLGAEERLGLVDGVGVSVDPVDAGDHGGHVAAERAADVHVDLVRRTGSYQSTQSILASHSTLCSQAEQQVSQRSSFRRLASGDPYV
jgi:hypothetical protein